MRYQTGVHHRFELDGQAFAYASASAAVVGLDELSDDVLAHFSGPEGAELEPWRAAHADSADASGAFEELVAMGLLRPLGEVPPPADELPPMPYPLATLVLNVTNKCNLASTYCYEYGEDRIADAERGGRQRATRMSPETARRSVDFLLERSAGRRDVTITFFGGETVLNFETIRAAVLHAEQRARGLGKRVGFSLTTNATLLTDEVIDFLVAHRFGVNVSIDGRKAEHDRHRTLANGEGTYERIVPRILRLLERNRHRARPVGARVTLTRGMGSIRETFRHLTEEIGFDQVGFAPVTSAPDHDCALAGSERARILDVVDLESIDEPPALPWERFPRDAGEDAIGTEAQSMGLGAEAREQWSELGCGRFDRVHAPLWGGGGFRCIRCRARPALERAASPVARAGGESSAPKSSIPNPPSARWSAVSARSSSAKTAFAVSVEARESARRARWTSS